MLTDRLPGTTWRGRKGLGWTPAGDGLGPPRPGQEGLKRPTDLFSVDSVSWSPTKTLRASVSTPLTFYQHPRRITGRWLCWGPETQGAGDDGWRPLSKGSTRAQGRDGDPGDGIRTPVAPLSVRPAHPGSERPSRSPNDQRFCTRPSGAPAA